MEKILVYYVNNISVNIINRKKNLEKIKFKIGRLVWKIIYFI